MRNLNLNSLNTHDLDSEHGQTTLKQPKHICSLSSFSLHAFCCHSICLNWRFAIEVAEHWILKFDPKTVTNLWGEPFCYKRELKAVEPVGLIVRKTQHPQSSLTEDTLKAFKNLLPPLERVQQVTQCELTHTLLQAGPKKGVCKNQWTGCQTNMQCTTSASMQLMCVFGWCFQTSDATNKKPLQSILHHLNCELQQLKECLQVSWSCLSSLELLCGWQFKSCLSAIKKFTHMSSQHACAQMTDQSVCDTILELLNHPNFHSHPVMSAKARSIKIRKYKKLFQQLQQLPETANLHAKCEHRHWWQTQAWKCYQRNDTCCWHQTDILRGKIVWHSRNANWTH